MASKVKCTCGWSWNKSDSSKKDMYICHECGRDNSNNMKNGGDVPQAQHGKKVPKETEADRAKRVAQEAANATGVGIALDQVPGLETLYDAYNVIDGYRQGDSMKILPNMMGALIPGTAGKAFEAITNEYLPKTPEKEKEKMKAVLKGKRATPEQMRKAQESVDWSEGFKKLYDDVSNGVKNSIDNVIAPLMGLKNGGWLDNYNDYNVSAPEGFEGDGYSNVGRNSSPAWGGQFQMGGVLPGAVGHMYARHGAPSEGKYAKKTLPSAQNGQEMQYYREGLDWKPKTISQDGTKVDYHTGDKVTYGTPEYKEAYDRGEVVTDQGEYSPIALDEVVIQNNYKRPRGFWEQYRDKIVDENKDAGVLGAIIGTPISAITSLPQLAMMKGFTGEMQRPSEAMDIQNPYGAMATDAILDPANLVGAGVLTKEKALARLAASKESGLLSNAYKLNPKAFKLNEENLYRQIGESGYTDAIESGVIRSADIQKYPNPYFVEKEGFNKLGSTGSGATGGRPNFIAEMPIQKNGEPLAFPTGKEHMWVAGESQMPLSDVSLYKKDWLQGYKPIEIPKTTQNFKLGINTMEELPPLPEDFLNKIKKLQESSKSIDMLKQDLADPETIRRAEALGVDPEIFAEASKNMTYSSNRDVPSSYSSSGLEININPNQTGRTPEEAIMSGVMDSHSPNFTANEIGAHELGHFFQDTNYWKNPYPKTISGFDRVMAHAKDLDGKPLSNILDYHSKYSTRDTAPTKVDEMLKDLEIRTGLDKEYYPQKNKNYFVDANKQYGTDVDNMIEKFPMFREYRQGMRDSGILKNKWDEITPEHIEDFRKLKPENRLNSFMQFNDKNYKLLNEVSKIAPAVLPIGLGAASQLEQKREGGIIKDDRGQWDHPGEITEIGSNEITMQGVPYDVLGISDTGDTKLMKPGKDYKFKGKKVTEYPMAKNGVNQQDQKTLQHIDQLTNFTNYNTKQPGGWLDTL